MDEQKLWKQWDAFGSRLTWEKVLEQAGSENSRQVAQQALGELPVITAVEALAANTQLVELLVGRRWYVMQAAREAGATWDDIGEALGMSRQGAYDWYRRKIADQARYAPDFHDAARARAVLDND
jgi:hypothetical protein